MHAPLLLRASTVTLVLFVGLLPPLLHAQSTRMNPEAAALLQRAVPRLPAQGRSLVAAEAARHWAAREGHLTYIGAPPGQHFPLPPGERSVQPNLAARSFLLANGRAFGVSSPAVDFQTKRIEQDPQRQYVRVQQTYQGIPVFAAEATVQLTAQDGVEAVLSDISTATGPLDEGLVSLAPRVSGSEAADRARAAFAVQVPNGLVFAGPESLVLFDPAVLDEPGEPGLVWEMEVFDQDHETLHFRVLVNAQDGTITRAWTLIPTALNRQIGDKTNSPAGPVGIVRTEGQAACGIPEADNAYVFLGDTYNFYQGVHSRDSWDDAGQLLRATVRYCDNTKPCPLSNAYANDPLRFGQGWVTDDIVAHEYTHRVTGATSGLIYTNQSGAINESLSDVWGEFVDLVNGRGNDDPTNRWRFGEERAGGGAIRNLQDPTLFNDPDRVNSPLYQSPANTNDNGGVHLNSGDNNKLCYLLTDGDTFNRQTIYGMGITNVARLYYEAQTKLLTSASGWTALFNALQQAAVNRNWSASARNNLYRACLAVEINAPGQDVFVDGSSNCANRTGTANCFATNGPYRLIAEGVTGALPGDTLRVRPGNYNERLTINSVLRIEAAGGVVNIGRN